MSFYRKPICNQFKFRTLLGLQLDAYLDQEASNLDIENWTIEIGNKLLFNRKGLEIILSEIKKYQGRADTLHFKLNLDPVTFRDYYSLHANLNLDIKAKRVVGEGSETIEIKLPTTFNFVPYPTALTLPDNGSIPKVLLMPLESDFDLLFAHQILVLAELTRLVSKNIIAVLKSFFKRLYKSKPLNIAANYNSIHRNSEVHPTAVIEGSIIEEGARVGAHSVVRFSHIGKNARLHDGAKVELSYIGKNSWLMHDLVFYRGYTEDNVFLIHGPYQFSGFQSGSSAFATIMMDYRPDAKPIKVNVNGEKRNYQGRFLGSILRQGAKTLGGSLVAPGQIIAENRWLSSEINSIHNSDSNLLPENKATPPPIIRA